MGAASAHAQATEDPLRSADCRRALEAMQAEEERAMSASAPAARLATRRRDAARACLGAAPAPQPPRASVRAPVRVDSPAASTVGVPRPAPLPAPASLPRAPLVVTACDATGCWASDGSRLQRLGADLVGPRGPCTVQGAVLNCPPSR